MSILKEISNWYLNRCNGDWEHSCGISIQTCDNPGWWVKIDLRGTPLADRAFQPLSKHMGPHGHPTGTDWLHCHIDDFVFHGAGDGSKLEMILQLFLEWAERRPASSPGSTDR